MNRTEIIVSQDHYFRNARAILESGYKVKSFEGQRVILCQIKNKQRSMK